MNELMAGHGGFEHNRQTLRILELLEERYPAYPGLNLTWEVREGIIKHQPESDALAPPEYAPGEAPTLEAQLVDFVDEIAYNNHDIDDGLASGMFGVEAIRAVRLFREAHDATLASGNRDEKLARHETVRRIIDRCASDPIATTLGEIGASLKSAADVRHAGGRIARYSDAMRPMVRELKDFCT
jgi:dGTPase